MKMRTLKFFSQTMKRIRLFIVGSFLPFPSWDWRLFFTRSHVFVGMHTKDLKNRVTLHSLERFVYTSTYNVGARKSDFTCSYVNLVVSGGFRIKSGMTGEDVFSVVGTVVPDEYIRKCGIMASCLCEGDIMQAIQLEIRSESVLKKVQDFIRTLPQNEIKMEIKKTTRVPEKKRLSAVKLTTGDFTFDREAAHER